MTSRERGTDAVPFHALTNEPMCKGTISGCLLLLLSLPLMGCAALGNGRLPTPEQIVLGMNHAKEGAQRTVLTKPAPGGVLVIHEELGFPQQNLDEYDVGYGYVTLDPVIGWRYAGGGSSNGTLTRPVFLVTYPNNLSSSRSMVVGLVRNPGVSRVTATFSNG